MQIKEGQGATHLLYDIRAELLDRQCAYIAGELTDNRIAEAVIVQVENILDDLHQKVSIPNTQKPVAE